MNMFKKLTKSSTNEKNQDIYVMVLDTISAIEEEKKEKLKKSQKYYNELQAEMNELKEIKSKAKEKMENSIKEIDADVQDVESDVRKIKERYYDMVRKGLEDEIEQCEQELSAAQKILERNEVRAEIVKTDYEKICKDIKNQSVQAIRKYRNSLQIQNQMESEVRKKLQDIKQLIEHADSKEKLFDFSCNTSIKQHSALDMFEDLNDMDITNDFYEREEYFYKI